MATTPTPASDKALPLNTVFPIAPADLSQTNSNIYALVANTKVVFLKISWTRDSKVHPVHLTLWVKGNPTTFSINGQDFTVGFDTPTAVIFKGGSWKELTVEACALV